MKKKTKKYLWIAGIVLVIILVVYLLIGIIVVNKYPQNYPFPNLKVSHVINWIPYYISSHQYSMFPAEKKYCIELFGSNAYNNNLCTIRTYPNFNTYTVNAGDLYCKCSGKIMCEVITDPIVKTLDCTKLAQMVY